MRRWRKIRICGSYCRSTRAWRTKVQRSAKPRYLTAVHLLTYLTHLLTYLLTYLGDWHLIGGVISCFIPILTLHLFQIEALAAHILLPAQVQQISDAQLLDDVFAVFNAHKMPSSDQQAATLDQALFEDLAATIESQKRSIQQNSSTGGLSKMEPSVAKSGSSNNTSTLVNYNAEASVMSRAHIINGPTSLYARPEITDEGAGTGHSGAPNRWQQRNMLPYNTSSSSTHSGIGKRAVNEGGPTVPFRVNSPTNGGKHGPIKINHPEYIFCLIQFHQEN